MRPLNIAVTGLNATDNPGPGVAVLRSLRKQTGACGRLIGLAYDALEPGVYAKDLVDDVFLIPYPSQGTAALEARLSEIDAAVGIDVLIPTLDAELTAFIDLAPHLRSMGIGTFLPTREQVALRQKQNLMVLGEKAGITVPKSCTLSSQHELYRIHEKIPYPFFVKGPYYGATLARSLDEATKAFAQAEAQWGLPIIVQQAVGGDEFNVVTVGDGHGGMLGAVPMRKLSITDKGKGWAGIAVRDEALMDVTRRFLEATRWRGPCEVEVMRDKDGTINLLEINPRFPAWVYLSAGAGMNLPWAVACLAAGRPVELGDYKVGTMFVRISLDQIADIEDFSRIATSGELFSRPRSVA